MNQITGEYVQSKMMKAAEPIIKRWAPVLDKESDTVKPITDPVRRYITAKVLENTANRLAADGGADAEELAFEAASVQTSAGVVASTYQKQVLGMIRQTYERLIAPEISSIQPISVPSAMGYNLKLVRDDGSDVSDHNTWGSSETYADHSTGENTEIQKGMGITLSQFSVALDTPKKLSTGYTVELGQDLQATHGLSAGNLLNTAATEEIGREIDGMLVRKAYTAATAHKTVTFGTQLPAGKGYNEKEWWQAGFGEAVLYAGESIYEDSGMEGDVLIFGTRASTFVSNLNDFRPSETFDRSQGGTWGLERIGNTMDGRFRMFRSRYVPTDEVLMLRKGTSILDGGLFYLPYIALYLGDPTVNQKTLKVERAYMSRFATYTASNKYFARIVVDRNASGIS